MKLPPAHRVIASFTHHLSSFLSVTLLSVAKLLGNVEQGKFLDATDARNLF